MRRKNAVRLISIEEEILRDNDETAEEVRKALSDGGTTLVNLMASPGAGKTSLILRSLEHLRKNMPPQFRVGVIEADMDSQVDADTIAKTGVETVQIRTGGFCHVDARMVEKTLQTLDAASFELLILENVGNLICPAQFDTGAKSIVMILSVPEGDDKPLKYPLMFRHCEALVVNKIDYLQPAEDFDMGLLEERVKKLNPQMRIFPVSCKTGEGIEEWCDWLLDTVSRP